MASWESIHLLWFEGLNICFIPTLHIEQFGHLSQKASDEHVPCKAIGAVRYFQCFYVNPELPLYIGNTPFHLDHTFKAELQQYRNQLNIYATAGAQVHLFRSFDVASKGAQFTGASFRSSGGMTQVPIDKYAFKNLRRGWQYAGVNLQEDGRIGPMTSLWIAGEQPTIKVTINTLSGVLLDIEQHSSYPSVDLNVRLERRRDEYPLEAFDISISAVPRSFAFAGAQALMHSDRVEFIPPKGFKLEIYTDRGPLSTDAFEYNSINSHTEPIIPVDKLWRTEEKALQQAPILKPEDVDSDMWSLFSERFPVMAEQVPMLSSRGVDLDHALKYFYELPSILIQLLLQQPSATLNHQIKDAQP